MKIEPGSISEARLKLLLKLTGIRSKPTIRALKAHLVQGFDLTTATENHHVTMSNFNRALRTVERVQSVVTALDKVK